MNRLLACLSYLAIILFITACKGEESTPDYSQELVGEYDCDYKFYVDDNINDERIGILTVSLQNNNEIEFKYSAPAIADVQYTATNFRKISNKYIVYDIPNQYTGYDNIYLEGNKSIEVDGKFYDGVYFIESSAIESSFSIESRNATNNSTNILTFTFDATKK